MDFSAFNPSSSNALNLAARQNNVEMVKKLLKKSNPNCVDNRGWTALHESAANDCTETAAILLAHPECRKLAETFEGHTALYLACRMWCSMKTINLLLSEVDDIANYASTEMVSPLHLASQQGRIAVTETLIAHNSMINLKDFDGDTALHDAAFCGEHEIVSVLLHAGAEPEVRNGDGYTPLHLAAVKGCFATFSTLFPFVTNIDDFNNNKSVTPLMIATQRGATDIVKFLLEHGADTNLLNAQGESAVDIALIQGHAELFSILLPLTDSYNINKEIVSLAMKPHYFNLDIITILLESDLDVEFFHCYNKLHESLEVTDNRPLEYDYNSPLCAFLYIAEYIYKISADIFTNLLYLMLMKGISVNASATDQCPPAVYIHFCEHEHCLNEVFNVLIEQGCNLDYKSNAANMWPDVFPASLATGCRTLPILLRHSLTVDADDILKLMCSPLFLTQVPNMIIEEISYMCGYPMQQADYTSICNCFPTLKHLCRLAIRDTLRLQNIKSTRNFLDLLKKFPIPSLLQSYIRFQ